ncbi:MAG: hypothetical protein ACYC7E_19605 [Armatimonadota bacterium]
MRCLARLFASLCALVALIFLLGCGGSPTGGLGSLAFAVNWGDRALPAGAVRVDVAVWRGESLVGETSIVAPNTTGVILGLPAGPASVYAEAFDDNSELVAEGSAEVTIATGGTTTATLLMNALPAREPYTITAVPTGGGVDDDLYLYLNGVEIYRDINLGTATVLPTPVVTFDAREGDQIRVYAIDVDIWWEGVCGLQLTRVSDGATYLLTPGVPAQLSDVTPSNVFLDETFTIAFP